jgi:hypothetical protein
MLYSLAATLIVFRVVFELVKWEYRVIPIRTQIHSDHFQAESKPVIENVQKDLNALGNEGWELVTVQDTSLPDGRMFTVAYLKRQTIRDRSIELLTTKESRVGTMKKTEPADLRDYKKQ